VAYCWCSDRRGYRAVGRHGRRTFRSHAGAGLAVLIMVTAPTANELYVSAAKFAQSALDAHHKGDPQRVAIDAGTALE
jgi:hypothetical protein